MIMSLNLALCTLLPTPAHSTGDTAECVLSRHRAVLEMAAANSHGSGGNDGLDHLGRFGYRCVRERVLWLFHLTHFFLFLPCSFRSLLFSFSSFRFFLMCLSFHLFLIRIVRSTLHSLLFPSSFLSLSHSIFCSPSVFMSSLSNLIFSFRSLFLPPLSHFIFFLSFFTLAIAFLPFLFPSSLSVFSSRPLLL